MPVKNKNTHNYDCLRIVVKFYPRRKNLQKQFFNSKNFLGFPELLNFVNNRVKALESLNLGSSKVTGKGVNIASHGSGGGHKKSATPKFTPSCKFPDCNESHVLFKCPKFEKSTNSARREFVREAKICFNCLRPGHQAGNYMGTKLEPI